MEEGVGVDGGGDAHWEELRREARRIEGDLDVKLSSYAKIGGMLSLTHSPGGGLIDARTSIDGLGGGSGDTGGGGGGSWKTLELEIEALLERLLDCNDAMSRCVAGATTTSSITQKLARHRDIFHEFTQEFRRTRMNVASMREHAELLSSVRNDISEYRASSLNSPSLLTERRAIHGNLTQMDDLISQAQNTKGVLAGQRTTFESVAGRMRTLGERFPVVRNLLGAIRRKKSRDTLILWGVVIACSSFLLIYWLAGGRRHSHSTTP
eukprot:TRINITY_DN386_c0_g1_i1.p1 TRINITY_DN386_c0_g1~~TRINITY_DN386_c0_g1_i1.p1  ORF type:complete len:266 (-),score=38.84 TRINITY_DN386_c0_g1_i1:842-1639(-)